jgi:hypothetical protein
MSIWIADAHGGNRKRFVARADEKLTAFLELEAAIRQKGLTLPVGCWQSRTRALSPLGVFSIKLHLALFPHGKTANVQGSLAQRNEK